ncbi:MAG: hypothetical protein IIA59_07620 [Candidatus Marinimicrobia bacterium]|nr:hypothetical protein [Candidatus Neomarinimicrobiota bacterium]
MPTWHLSTLGAAWAGTIREDGNSIKSVLFIKTYLAFLRGVPYFAGDVIAKKAADEKACSNHLRNSRKNALLDRFTILGRA